MNVTDPLDDHITAALSRIVGQAPPPPVLDVDKPRSLTKRSTAGRRYALVAVALFALGVGAVTLLAARQEKSGSDLANSSIGQRLVPTVVPDDLELVRAADDEDADTTDLGGYDLIYTTGRSTWVEGDRAVEVHVGVVSTTDDIDDVAMATEKELMIRGRRALLYDERRTVEGRADRAIGLVWFEQEGIVIELSAHQLTLDEVTEMAQSLAPVGEGEWRRLSS